MDGITTGMVFLTGLGLPEILLWVLTFAVVFGVITKLGIFGRAPSTLISIAVGFLVLLAVPAALITVIASMSTGLLVVAIAFLAVLALIEFTQAYPLHNFGTEKDPKWQNLHPFKKHGNIMAIIVLIIGVIIFFVSGGWALLGLGALPTIGLGTWLLIIVGAAVLWMLSEA